MKFLLYSVFILAPVLVPVKGCDLGWTKNPATGNCYKILYPSVMTWYTAKSRCAGYGAELLSIRSSQENEFVKGLMMPYVQANQMKGFWMGAQRSGSGWKWTDGTQVTFFDWHSGQPNNFNQNQNCLEMWWKDGKLAWGDQDCGISPWTAICKKPASANCRCGLAKRNAVGRIVGGKTTEVNEYPWQISIYTNNDRFPNACGGSVISDRWILTAAHCAENPNIYYRPIILGAHDVTIKSETSRLQIMVERVVLHPNYKKIECGASTYDFALLKLKSTINFDSHPNIRPICLPESNSVSYAGYNAIATGWGRKEDIELSTERFSPKLQEVTLKVLSNTECKATGYRGKCSSGSFWPIKDDMVCAGVSGGGKDACAGDSGGPLITSKFGNGVSPGQNYEIIGVTSFGDLNCGDPDFPGVYARVTKVLDWIKTTISGSKICPRV